jgi:hypothetical protein
LDVSDFACLSPQPTWGESAMSEQLSFTKIENELRPTYRNRLNTAESPEDIKKFFVYTAREFLTRALQDKAQTEPPAQVEYEDINLTPDADPPYTLSHKLTSHPRYLFLRERSDVDIIMNRLAQSASRRYVHLERNPDKSESKIRG